MTRLEKADRISVMLEEYPETPIPLDHTDAFTLLIAVLMSIKVPIRSQ